uniref:DNA-binding protein BIN4 n=1 Tax=Fragaria vesca subsp. vesca TaxID=101020 RepID=UPI0005C9E7D2|nr:PREDICTED: DNA-binding protein BIN4 [Fragaria vesca subsp. vesca]XP_011470158.1 PREDICTED: DNA-binding protein BIN4 [Fragaria vesca subsp. vesca]XP_011470160.1 PREDICTED: DNA-binding protein BIN4 [Fragaria vesca subsp. vesca]XP_011470161.1 PREDICTED: DNA-binding protein BIN4 [Fragaria vesca subsp. vesca]
MSREGSPDWLRAFEVPTTESVLSLSSDSRSSLNGEDNSDGREPTPRKSSESDDDDNEVIGKFLGKRVGSPSDKKLKGKSPKKGETIEEHVPQTKKKSDGFKKIEGKTKAVVEKPSKPNELNDSVLALSSDSDPENSPPREDDGESSDLKMSQLQSRGNTEDAAVMDISEESPSKQASKGKSLKKSPKGKGQSPKKEKNKTDSKEKEGISGDVEVAEKEASDKQIEPHVSSSTLPLVLSEKVHRTKALVECEKDSIDLSGDMGAVGRVIVSESRSGHSEMCLDLKGTVYKTTIVPSRTFCVVSFGPSEAKIEAIMNDFIQLKPETYEAETMVEGTLEGFLFDSEDEADKVPKTMPHQTDKDEDTEEQTNGKTKGKADKASKVVKKRDKPSGGKPQPPKKARKKTQVSKKPKNKK